MGSRAGIRSRRRFGSRNRTFVLQWHVTARCDEECRHCYARGSLDLKRQLEEEQTMDTCLKVVDSYSRFLRANRLLGRLNLTGGDPLLKEGLFDIIARAREHGILVGILGNPGHLDLDIARRLRRAGVFRYQLSLDGLEATHDTIRDRPGHFEETMKGLDILRQAKLPSVIMFTLSRLNAAELPSVAELVSDRKVDIFDFGRLIPQGGGKVIDMLGPEDYRQVLVDVLETYRRLEARGSNTFFGRKEALWNLLYSEKGLFEPPEWDGHIHSGCSAGSKVLTVLADGTVYPCRRLPIEVGRVPEGDLGDIFMNARFQVELRDVSKFQKCRTCRFLPFCRGCPGVAFGASNDPFAPDPQCWKDGSDELPKMMAVKVRKGFGLKDFAMWAGRPSRQCAICDGVCGGCASVCGACSEVCAACGGCGDT